MNCYAYAYALLLLVCINLSVAKPQYSHETDARYTVAPESVWDRAKKEMLRNTDLPGACKEDPESMDQLGAEYKTFTPMDFAHVVNELMEVEMKRNPQPVEGPELAKWVSAFEKKLNDPIEMEKIFRRRAENAMKELMTTVNEAIKEATKAKARLDDAESQMKGDPQNTDILSYLPFAKVLEFERRKGDNELRSAKALEVVISQEQREIERLEKLPKSEATEKQLEIARAKLAEFQDEKTEAQENGIYYLDRWADAHRLGHRSILFKELVKERPEVAAWVKERDGFLRLVDRRDALESEFRRSGSGLLGNSQRASKAELLHNSDRAFEWFGSALADRLRADLALWSMLKTSREAEGNALTVGIWVQSKGERLIPTASVAFTGKAENSRPALRLLIGNPPDRLQAFARRLGVDGHEPVRFLFCNDLFSYTPGVRHPFVDGVTEFFRRTRRR